MNLSDLTDGLVRVLLDPPGAYDTRAWHDAHARDLVTVGDGGPCLDARGVELVEEAGRVARDLSSEDVRVLGDVALDGGRGWRWMPDGRAGREFAKVGLVAVNPAPRNASDVEAAILPAGRLVLALRERGDGT